LALFATFLAKPFFGYKSVICLLAVHN